VIVPQKVQEAVEGQNPQFHPQGMALFPGLAAGDAEGNRQIS
jgi:hypothetical protein